MASCNKKECWRNQEIYHKILQELQVLNITVIFIFFFYAIQAYPISTTFAPIKNLFLGEKESKRNAGNMCVSV